MDTIAVVGSGERALAVLELLARCRFELVSVSTRPEQMRVAIRRRLPHAARAGALEEARFVDDLGALFDCSVVLECNEATDAENHLRALLAIESRMSDGAVLASTVADAERVASELRRPEEFVGLANHGNSIRVVVTDHTAPGAAFAVERLLLDLGREPTSPGLIAAIA